MSFFLKIAHCGIDFEAEDKTGQEKNVFYWIRILKLKKQLDKKASKDQSR